MRPLGGADYARKPLLLVVLFFAFAMFMLVAPLPLWFRIVGMVAAVAAY